MTSLAELWGKAKSKAPELLSPVLFPVTVSVVSFLLCGLFIIFGWSRHPGSPFSPIGAWSVVGLAYLFLLVALASLVFSRYFKSFSNKVSSSDYLSVPSSPTLNSSDPSTGIAKADSSAVNPALASTGATNTFAVNQPENKALVSAATPSKETPGPRSTNNASPSTAGTDTVNPVGNNHTQKNAQASAGAPEENTPGANATSNVGPSLAGAVAVNTFTTDPHLTQRNAPESASTTEKNTSDGNSTTIGSTASLGWTPNLISTLLIASTATIILPPLFQTQWKEPLMTNIVQIITDQVVSTQ